jgi:hypothetical protein
MYAVALLSSEYWQFGLTSAASYTLHHLSPTHTCALVVSCMQHPPMCQVGGGLPANVNNSCSRFNLLSKRCIICLNPHFAPHLPAVAAVSRRQGSGRFSVSGNNSPSYVTSRDA